jgi:hypothetical protein
MSQGFVVLYRCPYCEGDEECIEPASWQFETRAEAIRCLLEKTRDPHDVVWYQAFGPDWKAIEPTTEEYEAFESEQKTKGGQP